MQRYILRTADGQCEIIVAETPEQATALWQNYCDGFEGVPASRRDVHEVRIETGETIMGQRLVGESIYRQILQQLREDGVKWRVIDRGSALAGTDHQLLIGQQGTVLAEQMRNYWDRSQVAYSHFVSEAYGPMVDQLLTNSGWMTDTDLQDRRDAGRCTS